jgi:phosphohistidine phosphatase
MRQNLHTLILMRHGEAESKAASDHKRRLTPRGQQDTLVAGQKLHARFQSCDMVITSDATRTLETAQNVSLAFTTKTIIPSENLYTAHTVPEFFAAIASHLDSSVKILLVTGHNPVISAACSWLTGSFVGFSPGDYAILTLDTESWNTGFSCQGCWSEK